jgi:hypothetical protein
MCSRFNRRFFRVKWLPVAATAFVLTCAASTLGVAPAVATKLVCQTLPQVVLCAVHLDPNPGSSVKWAEAELVSVPAFVRPLKSKATYRDNQVKRPPIYLALTPAGRGKGELGVMVRVVVCGGDAPEPCAHVSRRLEATISVPAE